MQLPFSERWVRAARRCKTFRLTCCACDSKAWSLPAAWIETEGKETHDSELFDYKLSMVLPIGGVNTPIEIGQGKLIMPVPKEEGDEPAADGDEPAAAVEVPPITDGDPRAAVENGA